MDRYWKTAQALLGQTATVRIDAYPDFLLEFFLSLLMGCVYVYLTFEIKKIYKQTVNIKPHAIHFQKFVKSDLSKESVCTSVSHVHHEYKFDVIHGVKPSYKISKRTKRTTSNTSHIGWLVNQGEMFKPIVEEQSERLMPDKLAALTPAQFVKLDKQRQLSEKKVKGCMHSLTTLFDNVTTKRLTQKQLHKQIDQAKEEAYCTRLSEQVFKYLDAESVTDSLINVLNDIVEDTTMDNPLPVTGELTSLVYDIGNLSSMNDKPSMLFDTKCELVQSSTSISTATKTDLTERDEVPLVCN